MKSVLLLTFSDVVRAEDSVDVELRLPIALPDLPDLLESLEHPETTDSLDRTESLETLLLDPLILRVESA